jgi:predicted MFS family arabinose efflux permease
MLFSIQERFVLNYSVFSGIAPAYTGCMRNTSAAVVACGGLAALAVAMGIGRFAFTPLLPTMQDEFGLTLAEGGWLAAANYVGYLAGALSATLVADVARRGAIRLGLATIALSTLAMGATDSFAAWMLLRFLPGFASAWVLVCVSAWSLELLGKAGRPALGGAVYAGVGAGIAFAGVACLILIQAGGDSRAAWAVLGAAALAVALALWPVVGSDAGDSADRRAARAATAKIPEFWRLVFCHGAFGFGYIIPATFLPVMAKQTVAEPLWFGLAWPVFGAAALASTLAAARLARVIGQREVWILGNVAMGIGVLVPIGLPGLAGIAVAAICVGGTFMVNTMVGMQEARRVAGARAAELMAAMTSAFAVGQMAGPLLVGWLSRFEGGFSVALAAAAVPLFAAAWTLFMNLGKGTPWIACRRSP